MSVTLLGTGMPQPDVARRGPSQVVDAGGELLLVDCGAGTLYRLLEAGHDGRHLRRILLTHLHSDHTTGLADLLWAGWTQRWWDRPPGIAGPPGTKHLVEHLIDAHDADIRYRTGEGWLRREALVPDVEEIDDGWAVESDTWRLRGFRVEHEPVDHAFGFRVDTDTGSIVLSGDTRRSENLVRHAQDVDVLVHEVIWRPGMERLMNEAQSGAARARWARILGYHTPAEDVGAVATEAGAARVVLTHVIAPGGGPDDLLAGVRTGYEGPVAVGQDLERIALR